LIRNASSGTAVHESVFLVLRPAPLPAAMNDSHHF
jgi:hypothetical protein